MGYFPLQALHVKDSTIVLSSFEGERTSQSRERAIIDCRGLPWPSETVRPGSCRCTPPLGRALRRGDLSGMFRAPDP